ncbi:methyltransferase domain-containing protein [Nocardioides sp. GCM10027113]|uniref:methyltransferase domain-containing protein n=1 Tax=unclassified Nocardioides TaxID=2615069 RepID=UPI0036092C9D
MTPVDAPFTTVFARALRGEPCAVVGPMVGPGGTRALPVAEWTREADDSDALLLEQCDGPTIDIGCGPGRLTAALAALGHLVLGIDVVPEAVGLARRRGGAALHRDVFGPVPGEGRWGTALLADGNIGIGGDPGALLARVRQLLDPRGRVVVELAGPGTGTATGWAVLECAGLRSRPFRWSVVGVDAVAALAAAVGLAAVAVHTWDGRWCAVLETAT